MKRLAWTVFSVYAALAATALVLSALGRVTFGEAFVGLPLLAFALVGALVASSRRGNAVGWLFLALAIAAVAHTFVEGYLKASDDPDRLPAATLAGWYDSWGWYVWMTLGAIFVPLVFPDGRLPSPRWRPLLGLAVAGAIIACASTALMPGELDVARLDKDNPFGIPGATGALDAAEIAAVVLIALGFATAAAALVVRFRRSHGAERHQVKWVVFIGLLIAAALLLAAISDAFHSDWGDVVGGIGWFSVLVLLVFGLPVAVGLAIFRYRLYEIDVVINRTLVYGSLTALLAGTYVGFVLLFQLALRPLTGGSGLAVALSTLAVAALFRPARNRIQALVDRRFYRHKYDAERTLQAFAGRLRDEVDLDALRVELTAVVAETMQPAHVSLWLREASR